MSIKVTLLGTGTSQGVPLIGCRCEVCTSSNSKNVRLRSSILIESSQTRVVIDTGPDFRQQMLMNKIDRLDAVVFTHEHKDHIAGLDEVRAFNYITKKRIPVYASTRVQLAIKREFAYIFAEEKYPGIPEIDLIEIDNQEFKIGNINFIPVEVLHLKLPVMAFRVNDFAYVTDANFISDNEKKKLKNLEVLILNALRHEFHPSHFTFKEAINLVKELNPKKAYFTHISHQLGLHDKVSETLPEQIELGVDGLQLVI